MQLYLNIFSGQILQHAGLGGQAVPTSSSGPGITAAGSSSTAGAQRPASTTSGAAPVSSAATGNFQVPQAAGAPGNFASQVPNLTMGNFQGAPQGPIVHLHGGQPGQGVFRVGGMSHFDQFAVFSYVSNTKSIFSVRVQQQTSLTTSFYLITAGIFHCST